MSRIESLCKTTRVCDDHHVYLRYVLKTIEGPKQATCFFMLRFLDPHSIKTPVNYLLQSNSNNNQHFMEETLKPVQTKTTTGSLNSFTKIKRKLLIVNTWSPVWVKFVTVYFLTIQSKTLLVFLLPERSTLFNLCLEELPTDPWLGRKKEKYSDTGTTPT